MKRLSQGVGRATVFWIFVAVLTVLHGWVGAETFNDHLVQPPALEAPARGTVGGSLSTLAFGPAELSRGSYSLNAPIDLPSERGASLVSPVPSYNPEGGISEWGMGWQVELAIRRHRAVGDFEYDGTGFASPWGRLELGSDGFYYPSGLDARIRLALENNEWTAILPDGTKHRFAERLDTSLGTYAWYLTEVASVLGDKTEIAYERNDASSRPFVSLVTYGARGHTRDQQVAFTYEPIAWSFPSFASGEALYLDRRVRSVTARVRPAGAADGVYETRWQYDIRYRESPLGPAFYLAGITKTFASGASEPEVSYTYDLGEETLSESKFSAIPGLEALVQAQGAVALQPTKTAVLDVERDGRVELEHHYDLALWRQTTGGWTRETLADNPEADPRCRPAPSVHNQPRVLARMLPGAAAPQALRIQYSAANVTQMLVCDRSGTLLQSEDHGGDWSLGPHTRLVDVNRDGRPDLVRLLPVGVKIFANTSVTSATGATYSFEPASRQYLTPTVSADTSWLHDMNGDGLVDIVRRLSSNLMVWYGQGRFRFNSKGVTLPLKTLSGGYVYDLDTQGVWFVDANRDGLTDVLLTQSYLAKLFLNRGGELRQHRVPALRTTDWSMSNPVLLDLRGNGDDEIVYVRAGESLGLALNSVQTGLLVAADDGKGTVVRFGYERPAAFAQSGHRPSVLAQLTIESSGYDTLTTSYTYRNPTAHSQGRFLVGYGSVEKEAPFLKETVTLHNDDDLAGVVKGTLTTDSRTPGLEQFSTIEHVEPRFAGVRWLRPASNRTGWRDTATRTEIAETTEYLAYANEICPTTTRSTNAHGRVTEETTLAAPSGLEGALHCLPESLRLSGAHTDQALDFQLTAKLTRNTLGQVTHVNQLGDQGPLLLQEVEYDSLHRPERISAPGRGATLVTYDDDTGLLHEVTAPDGVISRATERDRLTGALRALLTDRGAGGNLSAFFRYDGFERLEKTWRDFGGSSEAKPAESLRYHFPATDKPGAIEVTELADSAKDLFRKSVALVTAANESVTDLAQIPQGWQLSPVISRSRADRSQSSARRDSLANTENPTTITYATLGQGAVFMGETRTAGFGHSVHERSAVQSGVERILETSQRLAEEAIVTEVVENDLHKTQSAVDAGGRVRWVQDQAGNRTAYGYDALGRLVGVTLPDGARHIARFDTYGRPALIERDDVGRLGYSYDATTGLLGRKDVFDADGTLHRSVAFAYDTVGRIKTETHTLAEEPDTSTPADLGKQRVFTYTYDGKHTEPAAPGQKGHLTQVESDDFHRTSEFNPDGTLRASTYSLAGWMEVRNDLTYRADGATATITRTVRHLPTDTIRERVKQEFAYDQWGRLFQHLVDDDLLFEYAYDAHGLLEQVTVADNQSVKYTYDPLTHGLSAYTHEGPSWTAGVDWDLSDRALVAQETMSWSGVETERRYEYKPRAFLETVTDTSDGLQPRTARYEYDVSGLSSYASDERGERRFERSGNSMQVGAEPYLYDRLGRIVRKGEREFVYGPDGQLQSARLDNERGTNPEGDPPAEATGEHPAAVESTTEWRYSCDEEGNRVLKREGDQPVAGYLDGGYLTADGFVEPVRIQGRLVGILEAGQFHLLATDPRSTLLADRDGTPRMASAFGVRTTRPDLSAAIDYVEKGYDDVLGTVRFGVRDYDPLLGQWLTPDPLFFEDPEKCLESPVECNLYAYARNDPVDFSDPKGLQIREWQYQQLQRFQRTEEATDRAYRGLKEIIPDMSVDAALSRMEAQRRVNEFFSRHGEWWGYSLEFVLSPNLGWQGSVGQMYNVRTGELLNVSNSQQRASLNQTFEINLQLNYWLGNFGESQSTALGVDYPGGGFSHTWSETGQGFELEFGMAEVGGLSWPLTPWYSRGEGNATVPTEVQSGRMQKDPTISDWSYRPKF